MFVQVHKDALNRKGQAVKDFIECEGGRWIPRERIEYILPKSKSADKLKTVDGEIYDTFAFSMERTVPMISVMALMPLNDFLPVTLVSSAVTGAVLVDDETTAVLCGDRVYFAGANLATVEMGIGNQMGGEPYDFEGELDADVCRKFSIAWSML